MSEQAPRVTLYYSSVSGMVKVKKAQSRIQDLLAAHKVPYTMLDIAAEEDAKKYMQSKSGSNVIPQIFVDGEYKGDEFIALQNIYSIEYVRVQKTKIAGMQAVSIQSPGETPLGFVKKFRGYNIAQSIWCPSNMKPAVYYTCEAFDEANEYGNALQWLGLQQ